MPPSHREFSDPVYKEIALANGHINRMNRDELRAKLSELKLDTRLEPRCYPGNDVMGLAGQIDMGQTDSYVPATTITAFSYVPATTIQNSSDICNSLLFIWYNFFNMNIHTFLKHKCPTCILIDWM